jgi:peptidoglycan/LPS O-acetylase OafA/YrhL
MVDGTLGRPSYAIYMVHALLVEILNRGLLVAGSLTHAQTVTWMPIPGGVTGMVFIHDRVTTDLFVLLYLAAVLVAADLAHRAVEQPGRRFFNRLAKAYRQRQSFAPVGAALGGGAKPAG